MIARPFALTLAALAIPMLWSQQPPRLTIFMQFDGGSDSAAVAGMETEVDRLFQPSGMDIAWRSATDEHNGESFFWLAVLHFKGKCSAEYSAFQPPPTPGETETLGASEVADGHVLPYAEIRCDAVRKALAFLRPGAGLVDRQAAIGRALGRVVAHELYHILANARSHSHTGLARAIERLPDLISPGKTAFLDADWVAISQNLRSK